MNFKEYMNKQKNLILDFARELHSKWEITKTQLNETYFKQFIWTTQQK